MNLYLMLGFSGLIAIINGFAVSYRQRKINYITKPGPILILIITLFLLPSQTHLTRWFIAALSLSAAGDILLLFGERFFLLGLGAFLGAHLSYIIALNKTLPPRQPPLILLLLGAISLTSALYTPLYKALRKRGQKSFILPTLLYALSLTGMLTSCFAAWVRPTWSQQSSFFLSLGGSSFFLSDAMLAWHRFISTLKNRDIKVRLTYYLGQICLAFGVILQSQA
ncbi:MAG: lysoplasmalogenase [Anaerolineales bacterium]|nr:lysoplasmalogenase [Anaerolineales bacterium]MBS3752053.1 lysoplasmalogenase [Anaerolineales bacterium]